MSDTVSLLAPEYLDSFAKRQQAPVDAIPTPFEKWNRQCRDDGGGVGIARGWIVTVAGATGHGKSLAALNLAWKAIEAGESVAFVSLEMTHQQIANRFYSIATGVPVHKIERGPGFDPSAFEVVKQRIRALRVRSQWGAMLVNSEPLFRTTDVVQYMKHLRDNGLPGGRTSTCEYFVLDYMQLVGTGSEKTILDRVTEVSTAVREFAKREHVTVIALSQLNRMTSRDRTAPPLVQGLMGGSPLENDSDQVLLLDHSRYERRGTTARTWIILGKNRHGGTGEIAVEWDYATLRCREAMSDEVDEWPDHGKARLEAA